MQPKVSERWKEQYCKHGEWVSWMAKAKEIYPLLLNAEEREPGNFDLIDEIIGNPSWTHSMCSMCSKWTREPMFFWDQSEYDFHFCDACLRKARQSIRKERQDAR